MSRSRGAAPTAAEAARAHAQVGTDERRARVAWSRVLENRRERASDVLPALLLEVISLGHVEAWHRLVDGDLPKCAIARAHVAGVDVDAELDRVERVGARVVVPGDADWPESLSHPLVSPHLLHVRGHACLADLVTRSVAVVGSRASTGYGEAIARELGAGLAGRGQPGLYRPAQDRRGAAEVGRRAVLCAP